MLKKIKNFLLILLFGSKKPHKMDAEKPVDMPTVEHKPTKKPATPVVQKPSANVKTSSPHAYGKHDNGYGEPQSTGTIGQITSFLWKPDSDHGGEPVVVVSCDDVPTNELFIEVFNSNGNPMKSVDSNAFSRANKLDSHKFARISFRLGVTKKTFKKSVPLKVQFYQVVDGKKHILSIKNRGTQMTIKDPAKRVEWT